MTSRTEVRKIYENRYRKARKIKICFGCRLEPRGGGLVETALA